MTKLKAHLIATSFVAAVPIASFVIMEFAILIPIIIGLLFAAVVYYMAYSAARDYNPWR